MTALLNPRAWLAAAMLVLVAAIGWQSVRLADSKGETAAARADLAAYRATAAENVALALRAARAEEARLQENNRKAVDAAKNETTVARADAVRAESAADRLSRQLAAYRAAVRRAFEDPAAAGGSPPADKALDLLADLLGGSGKVLVELGKFADASHIAGRTCERIADQLQPAGK